MTEQNNASATVEETTPVVATSPQPEPAPKKSRAGVVGIALGAIAIAIALALGGGLYSYGKHQAATQTTTNGELASQLSALQQQQEQQKIAFDKTLQQQSAALNDAAKQQAALAHRLDEVQQKVTQISGSDSRTWLLAQADFLVKMAGRKLWNDGDVTTAAALLKSADESLAEMNDPSLIEARRAITNDIATLSSVTQVDYDGIILKLNQLANGIDNLRLADNNRDDSPMDSDANELSGSITEWRRNLAKSWHNFTENFITIHRRDETAVPLLAPNQDIYLRENIRSRLLVAAQAVPRHQDATYKQSLDNVSTWVRAWYDTNDPATKAYLDEVDDLSQQNITMDTPQTLQSQALLAKLMQTRVRNLLAQPAASANAPDRHAEPAPAAGQGE